MISFIISVGAFAIGVIVVISLAIVLWDIIQTAIFWKIIGWLTVAAGAAGIMAAQASNLGLI